MPILQAIAIASSALDLAIAFLVHLQLLWPQPAELLLSLCFRMQDQAAYEARELNRWAKLVLRESKSLASDSNVEVDEHKKDLLKAEMSKLIGLGEVADNCSGQAAEILAGAASELLLNSLLMAFDLTKYVHANIAAWLLCKPQANKTAISCMLATLLALLSQDCLSQREVACICNISKPNM